MSDPLARMFTNSTIMRNITANMKCAQDYCPMIAPNSRYCSSHRCVVRECGNARKTGTEYCDRHACIMCGNRTEGGRNRCQWH